MARVLTLISYFLKNKIIFPYNGNFGDRGIFWGVWVCLLAEAILVDYSDRIIEITYV
ncbi:hypothetical protein [Neobacillus niacini]|uniref:hypothetical protein n=1 Tax=Neobacillus niacini TaxID=86668 RepID=UPI00285CC37B|nr:hypothetical protein [Neobacillus niacini]MDR7001979.1 hypothetical protein [Neobacillus niacini]